MCNRIFIPLFSAMIMLISNGCGMSGSRINFDELKYPASMSGSLYGPAGDSIEQGTGLNPVQDFEYTKDLCSILYSIIPVSRSDDIIELMNNKIETVGGDGITNVSISSDYSMLTSVFPLNYLPVWPGCSRITVRGTIVKLEQH